MNSKYEVLLSMPHHVSKSRPQMSAHDRAAQFSPFAALTGYDGVLQETGRVTEQRIDLTEEQKAVLDHRIRWLVGQVNSHPAVSITYFVKDVRKEGGAYLTHSGKIRKIQEYERLLVLEDGIQIPIDDILRVEAEHFQGELE